MRFKLKSINVLTTLFAALFCMDAAEEENEEDTENMRGAA